MDRINEGSGVEVANTVQEAEEGSEDSETEARTDTEEDSETEVAKGSDLETKETRDLTGQEFLEIFEERQEEDSEEGS